jgi:hypothetical protein
VVLWSSRQPPDQKIQGSNPDRLKDF